VYRNCAALEEFSNNLSHRRSVRPPKGDFLEGVLSKVGLLSASDDRDGQSRILQAVHETATGLAQSGLITKRRLAELEAFCQIDVGEMSAQQISSLRESV
jgi:hypothetical protein